MNFFLSREKAADAYEQLFSGLVQLTLKICTLEQGRWWWADRWWGGGVGRQQEMGTRSCNMGYNRRKRREQEFLLSCLGCRNCCILLVFHYWPVPSTAPSVLLSDQQKCSRCYTESSLQWGLEAETRAQPGNHPAVPCSFNSALRSSQALPHW